MNEHPEGDPSKATVGLEARYEVTKINDPEGKHKDCRVFVLDPQHDKNARKALLEYAGLAAQDGQDQLAIDIIEWVGQIELREHHPRLAEELDREVAAREADPPMIDAIGSLDATSRVIREQGDGSAMDGLLNHFGVDGDFAVAATPENEGERKWCPVHKQTDCSPLLNGCSRITTGNGVTRDQLDRAETENKGGYSMSIDPTDGKRI